jgi:parvulin-like peptidyl-prolyl isomerase
MKAVILEIIKGRAVVMKADGSVTKIRNKNYRVGDEIYMKEGVFSHKRWAPILTALLIFAMIGTGTWAYATPAYKISVVGEDDMLFEVNKLGKVIKVRYEGEESNVLEPEGDFNGKDINEAIILVLDELGYEDDEYENLVITAIAKNKEESERIAKSLQERMDEYWAEKDMEETQDEIVKRDRVREEIAEIKGLGQEDLAEAERLGITPGKYNIITNLMEVDAKSVDRYLNRIRSEYGIDEDEDTDNKELSKRIMEEFSARIGEKNNPSVNAPGQADKDEKDERDNPSQFAPGQVKKLEANDNDEDAIDDEDEENGESGRPASPGKSNEAPGQNKDKTKNN